MTSPSSSSFRTYDRAACVTFRKTNEAFGGLSNMASGYPIVVDDVLIRTCEALYQALRFPTHADIQQRIIDQKSPMAAKMVSKPYRAEFCRPDWHEIRVNVMRWCIRAKLVCSFDRFAGLLLATGDKSIVEDSARDTFWGARPSGDERLEGQNVLGRLLMELRENVRHGMIHRPMRLEPMTIADFVLLQKPIGLLQEVPTEPQRPSSIHPRLFDE